MPAVSCVVHLWSWKPINNKTKCDKHGLGFLFFLSFFSFSNWRELDFNICHWLWGQRRGGVIFITPDWMNFASWGGPLLSLPYKCLAPVAIPSSTQEQSRRGWCKITRRVVTSRSLAFQHVNNHFNKAWLIFNNVFKKSRCAVLTNLQPSIITRFKRINNKQNTFVLIYGFAQLSEHWVAAQH